MDFEDVFGEGFKGSKEFVIRNLWKGGLCCIVVESLVKFC